MKVVIDVLINISSKMKYSLY